jgi:hypothetical protein
MARKRGRKSFRHYTAKIPLAMTAGLAGTILGGSHQYTVLGHLQAGQYPEALARAVVNFTGYNMIDKTFKIEETNYLPLIIGAGASIIASKLGINRRMASMGLPIKI